MRKRVVFVSLSALLTGGVMFVPHSTEAETPTWKEVRNSALDFFRLEDRQTPTGEMIFRLGEEVVRLKDGSQISGMEGGLVQDSIAIWSRAGLYERLYKFETCRPLTHQPLVHCLKFNWNLNYASPLYLSWVFAHAYVQYIARAEAIKAFRENGVSQDDVHDFLNKLPDFVEVNQWGYLIAMRHWEELILGWENLHQRLAFFKTNHPPLFFDEPVLWDYEGRPAEHDYARVPYNEDKDFSEVARQNRAGVTELYSYWTDKSDLDVSLFLSIASPRFLGVSTAVRSLHQFLEEPPFKYAAFRLLEKFNTALEAEKLRRQEWDQADPSRRFDGSTWYIPKPVISRSKAERFRF